MADCHSHVLRTGVAKVLKMYYLILYVFAGVLNMHHVQSMLVAGITTVNMTQGGGLGM